MDSFKINKNIFLSKDIDAFFHTAYTRMGNPENPDYLNELKNTYGDHNQLKLQSAVKTLHGVLKNDLSCIRQLLNYPDITVCVVPRAKAEEYYSANQKLFRKTVDDVIAELGIFSNGTGYIRRHTNTYTTHLGENTPNYNNDGKKPYPGITLETCNISSEIKGKNILLIDDIYTPGINIDEDAISALINSGACSVIFYAVGRVIR